MTNWELVLLVAGLSLLTALGALLCQTAFQVQDILPRWAKENGYRIVHQELRSLFTGPFPMNRYRPVYRIVVEDRQRKRREGWARLGWWYVVSFKEHIEVRWDA